jgi:hypothetical protein
MMLTESELKARTQRARGNASAQRSQCHLLLPERVGCVDHDAAVEPTDCLQHVCHGGARDGHEHHFGGCHGVGDGGRVCALPEFGRQRPRPGGVPCRERDVVAGGAPEPAYRRADAADSENSDLHSAPPAIGSDLMS